MRDVPDAINPILMEVRDTLQGHKLAIARNVLIK